MAQVRLRTFNNRQIAIMAGRKGGKIGGAVRAQRLNEARANGDYMRQKDYFYCARGGHKIMLSPEDTKAIVLCHGAKARMVTRRPYIQSKDYIVPSWVPPKTEAEMTELRGISEEATANNGLITQRKAVL